MDNSANIVKFGPYFLLERIAVGGMAEIWKAKTVGPEGFERIVAIKYILPTHTQNEDFNTMFIEEARIASSLNHNNIARITNFGIIDGKYYHEMEFIDGRSLRQLVKKTKKIKEQIPISSACFVISEVLKGLNYAHNKHDPITGEFLGIVHRDMSPQNIMLSFEGEVKIIDWGVAKVKGVNDDEAGVLKGKFGYMSPEQVDGLEIDHRSDLFSVAIIFYEILTGERLFVADNEINTIKKVKEAKVPNISKVNSDIDTELASIVMKGLAKDREQRYQTAQEFMEDITSYLYKRFPSYTSLELSSFVKETFKDEILEGRRRDATEELSITEKLFVDDNKTLITQKPEKPVISNIDKTKISKVHTKTKPPLPKREETYEIKQFSSPSLNQASIEEKTQLKSKDEFYKNNTSKKQKKQKQIKLKKTKVNNNSTVLPLLFVITFAYLIFSNISLIKDFISKIHITLPKKKTVQTSNKTIPETAMQTSASSKLKKTQKQVTPSIIYHSLQIKSLPQKATVIINGTNKGRTPISLKYKDNEKIELVVRHNEFKEFNKNFILKKDESLSIRLKPLYDKTKAYVSISVNPPSLIFINGKLVAKYSNLERHKVRAGIIRVRVYNKAYKIDYSFTMRARAGKNTKKNLLLM